MTADEIISSPRARVDPRTRATMPREATVATLARSKTPLSHFPEFAALKAELKELRDAAERKESREAKALRRRLTEQSERQAALSDAFTSLSDAILDEMETLKREMRELRADQEATARWRRATTRDVRALEEEARASVVRRGAEEMGESSPPASRLEQLCGVEDRVEALTRRVEACEAEARDASARRVDDLDLTRAALEAARRDQRVVDAGARRAERRADELDERLRALAAFAEETRAAVVEQGRYSECVGESVRVLRRAMATGGRGEGD